MNMPVMPPDTEILIYNRVKAGIRVFRAKPKLNRVLRLRHIDRHGHVLLFSRKTKRPASSV